MQEYKDTRALPRTQATPESPMQRLGLDFNSQDYLEPTQLQWYASFFSTCFTPLQMSHGVLFIALGS